jgi:hypothetical protein
MYGPPTNTLLEIDACLGCTDTLDFIRSCTKCLCQCHIFRHCETGSSLLGGFMCSVLVLTLVLALSCTLGCKHVKVAVASHRSFIDVEVYGFRLAPDI